MSHIRKVGIRSYRSIAKANLRLGEITVVIGPSDCGKSNIVRSLRDWSFNAIGSDFVTLGQAQTRVAAVLANGARVVFEKKKLKRGADKENKKAKQGASSKFVLAQEDEPAKSYEKVGTNVPPEVSEQTGIWELALDKDLRLKIQFSMQDDPWFLLHSSWSPSKVAKVVGKISGVDTLILAQRDLIQDRNWTKKEVKEATKEIDVATEALGGLEWVDQAREVLDSAEVLYESVVARKRSLRDAEAAVKDLRRLRGRQADLLERHSALTEFALDLEEIGYEERLERLLRAEGFEEIVRDLRTRGLNLEGEREELSAELDALVSEVQDMIEEGTVECPLCGQGAHSGCLEGLVKEASRTS